MIESTFLPPKNSPAQIITARSPMITLQTSPRFGDSEEVPSPGDIMEEAVKHGREAVRAWREAVPDDIKPYCHLQIEVRRSDHVLRYEAFRRVLEHLENAGIPADIQIADPHDRFVFDPVYVEKLLEEFSCIKVLAITENRFEFYSDFNVPRYATPPNTRYAMDMLDMACRHDKFMTISLQDLKWMHIWTDRLNEPLAEAIRRNGDRCIPISEHIGPRLIQRTTSVWGSWVAGDVRHWGVEPQSWWYENGRMIEPGIFGQSEPDNTRIMPPDLYRAMILLGAMLGATVYNFEPFWDLFDYDNSHCWRDVIYPTLMEVITGRYIPERDEILGKLKVAFQLKPAASITEFHENLRDVDWIGDKGLFARAAYGLWSRYLEHELIPNKGRHFFIPILAPTAGREVLDLFEDVVRPGRCDSVEAYEALLAQHYPPDENEAFVASVKDRTYVMQTHENLYDRQRYRVMLPRPVSGLSAEIVDGGVRLSWTADPGAVEYRVRRVEGNSLPTPRGYSKCRWRRATTPKTDPEMMSEASPGLKAAVTTPIVPFADPLPIVGATVDAFFLDTSRDPALPYTYTVTAITTTRAPKEGTVNYLDYLVFSETESIPGEEAIVQPSGEILVRRVFDPMDDRPEKQTVYPTFDGVESHHRAVADAIVAALDAFKAAYDGWDFKGVVSFYSEDYEDPNGHHREYVEWAWKWWFIRNADGVMLRQIRYWDFSEYETNAHVRVRLFSLCRAIRYDDQPFGYGYDGTMRIPRHADEEVVYTWRRETDGKWRIIRTDPAFPNMAEIMYAHRGSDQTHMKLQPGIDNDAPYTPNPRKNDE